MSRWKSHQVAAHRAEKRRREQQRERRGSLAWLIVSISVIVAGLAIYFYLFSKG